MIGLVRIALRRPYTFVVLALLIVIIGPIAALRTPTDIFPNIRIPVIAVVFTYTGLPPDPMSGRIVTPFSRSLTTTVNDIEHIESTSYTGFGIIKLKTVTIARDHGATVDIATGLDARDRVIESPPASRKGMKFAWRGRISLRPDGSP